MSLNDITTSRTSRARKKFLLWQGKIEPSLVPIQEALLELVTASKKRIFTIPL